MPETRTQIREKTVFALYGTLLRQNEQIDYDPPEILAGLFNVTYDEVPLFAKDIYVKALANEDEIVTLVSGHLKNWEFKRLNTLAQAIFLEAVSEGLYTDLTAKTVVIDSAVRLAKRYLDSSDYKYINAVLDKVLPADGEK